MRAEQIKAFYETHRQALFIYFDFSALAADSTDRAAAEATEALLLALDDDDRELVVLKALDGLTFEEIAAVRGEKTNTVASRYRRALAKMRSAATEEPMP